jgi:hypothetical protein
MYTKIQNKTGTKTNNNHGEHMPKTKGEQDRFHKNKVGKQSSALDGKLVLASCWK